MKILIIGGNGFMGSHLVDYLLLRGHHVRVLDKALEFYRSPLPGVDYRIFSLSNTTELSRALREIDLVYHMASSYSQQLHNNTVISDIHENLLPTINLLNLLVKSKIKRIVFFSSGSSVYGTALKKAADEEHPLNPTSSYGIMKITIEKYLLLYQKIYKLQPLIIRPSNKFGPRQGNSLTKGVISTFLNKIKLKEPITIIGNGNSEIDFIYIDDLIKLSYELSMRKEEGIFNIGSGEGFTINQVLQLVIEITGKTPEILYKDIESLPQNNVLDISKTTRVLNCQPEISLHEGIAELWKWRDKQDSLFGIN